MKLLFIGLTINRNQAAPEAGFGFEQIKIFFGPEELSFSPEIKISNKVCKLNLLSRAPGARQSTCGLKNISTFYLLSKWRRELLSVIFNTLSYINLQNIQSIRTLIKLLSIHIQYSLPKI